MSVPFDKNKIQLLVLGFILTGVIIFARLYLDDNAHFEFLYPLIVLLTISVPDKRTTFDFSVGLTLVILIDFFLDSNSSGFEKRLIPFFLPILFVWAFAFAILKYKNSQAKLITSTQHLNAMFEFATEGIIISNQKGVIILANPTSCRQLGYEVDELIGKKVEDLVPERSRSVHPGHRKSYYGSPHARPMGKEMNLAARKKDGTEMPVEISLSTFKIEDEVYVISFIIDITERRQHELEITRANEELELRVEMRTKELATANLSLALANSNLKAEMRERTKAEEALRDSERLYSTIAHNFPDGIICVLNNALKIVFIDGRELENIGIRSEDLYGKDWRDMGLCRVEREAEMSEALKNVFTWDATSAECEHDGRSYSMNAVPLPNAKGEVSEILLVIRNITRRKKAEKEMMAALEKERKLNEMKSRFVSIASHEFRTPLSTILSSISLVERYERPEEKEKKLKHVERIKSSVKNLTEILNDFLSLEKLEAGKVEVHPESIHLPTFCEELAEEMQALSNNGAKIRYTHLQGETEFISDKQLLRNILINLLNNAVKYSKPDGMVEFNTTIDGTVRLEVKDYGIGIPKEDQEQLFERFFRAGNVTAIQGTGLGLNIVRKYAQLLEGDISFSSELDKGSTFIVSLPKHPNNHLHEEDPAYRGQQGNA